MTSFTTPVQLRWTDLDAQGHVNNVTVADYMQQARAQVRFQVGQLATHRGQGHAQLPPRRGQAAAIHGSDEYGHRFEAIHGIFQNMEGRFQCTRTNA